MFLVSSCSCLCPIHWSQVWSREWRCSCSQRRQAMLQLHLSDEQFSCLLICLILYVWRQSHTQILNVWCQISLITPCFLWTITVYDVIVPRLLSTTRCIVKPVSISGFVWQATLVAHATAMRRLDKWINLCIYVAAYFLFKCHCGNLPVKLIDESDVNLLFYHRC